MKRVCFHDFGFTGRADPQEIVCKIIDEMKHGAALLPPVDRGMKTYGITPLDVLAGDHEYVFMSMDRPIAFRPSIALAFDAREMIDRGAALRGWDLIEGYKSHAEEILGLVQDVNWLGESYLECDGWRKLDDCTLRIGSDRFGATKCKQLARRLKTFRDTQQLEAEDAQAMLVDGVDMGGGVEIVHPGAVRLEWANMIMIATKQTITSDHELTAKHILNKGGWRSYTVNTILDIDKRVCARGKK